MKKEKKHITMKEYARCRLFASPEGGHKHGTLGSWEQSKFSQQVLAGRRQESSCHFRWEELFWVACCLSPGGLCSPGVWVSGTLQSLSTSYAHPVTSWLAGYKFTHEDCWKQSLEQNCSRDSEGWGGKLKNGACQIVFGTLLLSRGFRKKGKLWKWRAKLGGWYWQKKCSILGHTAQETERTNSCDSGGCSTDWCDHL